MKFYLFILMIIFSACSNDNKSSNNTISDVSKLQNDALDSSKTIKPQINSNVVDKNINIDNNSTMNITTKSTDAKSLYLKCSACHGIKGDMVAPGSEGNVLIGKLSKDEIIESLKGYRNRTLKKGKSSAIMYLQSANLSDNDIENLGEYISNFSK